jgi:membrane fusion protein, multidrug efflux system
MNKLYCLCLAIALTTAACGRKGAGKLQMPPRPVTVASAITRDVPEYLDEIGNCTPYESVTIQPQVTGPVTEIRFSDGQELQKGDPLFTIDPRPYQAALDKALATLEQDRAKQVFNETQLKRMEELRKTKVAAPQDLDNARSAELAGAATVQADEALVETAQINVDYCTIKSPIQGRASKRMTDVGNVVSPATQLLLIQRQDPIYVDFTIPESALPQVRKFVAAGTLAVQASFADAPSKNRTGSFDFLDSGVQPGAGTVRMRAILKNDDRLFWPGQFVNVRILLDTLKEAVLVPNEAIQVGNSGPFVFVAKDDSTAEMRPVKVGQRQGGETVISDGVKAGDKIVVTGQMTLAPGAKVAVVPDAGASPAGPAQAGMKKGG